MCMQTADSHHTACKVSWAEAYLVENVLILYISQNNKGGKIVRKPSEDSRKMKIRHRLLCEERFSQVFVYNGAVCQHTMSLIVGDNLSVVIFIIN